MNARAHDGRRSHLGRRFAAAALAVALTGLAHLGNPAEAARYQRGAAAGRRTTWSQFLGGGPTLWAATPSPRFPSGARLPTVNGALLQTPFVDYLLWRRGLNAARFDFYHPNIGRVLSQVLPPVEAIEASTVAIGDPVVTPTVEPVAQEIVPEPSAFAISATIVGALVLRRRRSRVPPRPASTQNGALLN